MVLYKYVKMFHVFMFKSFIIFFTTVQLFISFTNLLIFSAQIWSEDLHKWLENAGQVYVKEGVTNVTWRELGSNAMAQWGYI